MSLSDDTQEHVFEMILRGAYPEDGRARANISSKSIPEDWQQEHQEGQLAIDVLDSGDEVIVVSTMAGAVADQIEVYMHNDLLTIRGFRESPVSVSAVLHAYHEECFWGKFSRTVVLPVDVHAERARAEYTRGVLTIIVPKAEVRDQSIPITIIDD